MIDQLGVPDAGGRLLAQHGGLVELLHFRKQTSVHHGPNSGVDPAVDGFDRPIQPQNVGVAAAGLGPLHLRIR